MPKAHRDCMSCKYAELPPKGAGGAIDFNARVCYHSPASPVLVPTPQGMTIQFAYPSVAKGSWCYQWEGAGPVNQLTDMPTEGSA